MYTVIGTHRSRAFRVLWMLEELGQPNELIKAGPRSPEAREHNPSGKVPVLIEDGAAITDSTAILTYLADKHGALTYPSGTLDRARQDSATHFVLDEMDAVLWTASKHSFVLPEERRVPAVKEALRWEWRTSVARLAARLGDGSFVMGETMTVPDILAAHCLGWAAAAKFPVEDSAVEAYLERMRARPAYHRAVERAS